MKINGGAPGEEALRHCRLSAAEVFIHLHGRLCSLFSLKAKRQ